MEKYINEYNKECWRSVTEDSPFSYNLFHHISDPYGDDDIQYAFHSELGSLTVLDRLTGFGWRDIETGYRDKNGKFWLASGGYDVRESGCVTVGDAVEWVKQRANTCTGD